jgi:hypothetical protein
MSIIEKDPLMEERITLQTMIIFRVKNAGILEERHFFEISSI